MCVLCTWAPQLPCMLCVSASQPQRQQVLLLHKPYLLKHSHQATQLVSQISCYLCQGLLKRLAVPHLVSSTAQQQHQTVAIRRQTVKALAACPVHAGSRHVTDAVQAHAMAMLLQQSATSKHQGCMRVGHEEQQQAIQRLLTLASSRSTPVTVLLLPISQQPLNPCIPVAQRSPGCLRVLAALQAPAAAPQ